MSDFPPVPVVPFYLSSYSEYCFSAVEMRAIGVAAQPASATYPAANLAIYVPFFLPWDYICGGMGFGNGSSVAGNADVGIYAASGERLASTAPVARAGASSMQYVNFASQILLPPGAYYMGFSASSGAANTGWLNTSVVSASGKPMGLLQQASAHPLPATMTPAAWASTGFPLLFIFGI